MNSCLITIIPENYCIYHNPRIIFAMVQCIIMPEWNNELKIFGIKCSIPFTDQFQSVILLDHFFILTFQNDMFASMPSSTGVGPGMAAGAPGSMNIVSNPFYSMSASNPANSQLFGISRVSSGVHLLFLVFTHSKTSNWEISFSSTQKKHDKDMNMHSL